jgi:beta-glucosidase
MRVESVFALVVAIAAASLDASRRFASCPAETAFPWCNTSLPAPQRASLLVAAMAPRDRAYQLDTLTPPLRALRVPSFQWWSEGLHGVVADGTTSFPQVIGLSAAFDPPLWRAVGAAISTEARALWNDATPVALPMGGLNYFTPDINLLRYTPPPPH